VKFLASILAPLTLVFSLQAYSQVEIPHLGTPEKLLKEAQTGRTELLNVLLRLQDNVRELRDQKTFDNYFSLLDQFQVLSDRYNLEMIYPGAVKEVGRNMITHGNRWLKISTDSSDKILSYQKWSDLSGALLFQTQVTEELNKLTQPEQFKKAYLNLLKLKDWTLANYPNDLYLAPTYQSVIADLSFKALVPLSVLDSEAWLFWLKGINTQSSAQDYISFLNEKILADTLTQIELNQWMKLAVALGQQLETINKISSSVKNNYGVLVTDIISKALQNEIDLDVQDFEAIVKILDITSFRSLVFRWMNPEKPASDAYAYKLIALTEVLYHHAKSLKLGTTTIELEKFISVRLSPVIASRANIEGGYRLKSTEKGAASLEWYFSLVRETEDRMVASLCDTTGAVCYSFFNVQYSIEKKVFIASEDAPNDDIEMNSSVIIEFLPNETIRITNPNAHRLATVLTGKKVTSYANYMATPNYDADAIEGTYKGTIDLPTGTVKYRLTITSFGEYTVGRLETLNGDIRLELKKGTDGKIGFIYLTSGKNESRSWFHLRLKQNKDGDLEGFAVSAARGFKSKAAFTKVN